MNDNGTLYISDLDGTLLNDAAELSAYSARCLNELIADGLNFSVATARTPFSAGKILSGLTLNMPIVLLNGVIVQDKANDGFIKVCRIEPDTVMAVVEMLRKFKMTGFLYAIRDGGLVTYYESVDRKPLRDFMEERKTRYYASFRQAESFSEVSAGSVIYFSLLDTAEMLRPVHEALSALPDLNLTLYKDTYTRDLWFLEMFGVEASKYNAVKYLREACGFGRIVGFGDNYNDLPMFEACDVRVATANAKPEVKAAADFICDTNENDGVIKWIQTYY